MRDAEHLTPSHMTRDDKGMSGRDANLLGALAIGVNDAMWKTLVEATDLDATAVAALLVVFERPGRSITELAVTLGLTHSGAVRTVDRLTTRGLLVRRPGRDGRSHGIELSEAGTRQAERALAARRSRLQRLLDALAPEQQSVLTAAIAELLTQLPTTRTDAWRICRTCEHETCRGTSCPVAAAVDARHAETAPSKRG